MKMYRTFIRSCTNWTTFVKARKMWQESGLTYEKAASRCKEYNDHLNARQRRRGTKMEFTSE